MDNLHVRPQARGQGIVAFSCRRRQCPSAPIKRDKPRILFANANDPSLGIDLPLFVVILLSVITGVLAGGVTTWIRQGRWRRAARRHEADAAAARAEAVSGQFKMPSIVKICGLSTLETLDAALDAGADMVGFTFFPPSPRHLSLGVARELGARVKGRAKKVAVSIDADDATLENTIEALRPDLLQLHGKETVARIRDIKTKFGLPVMKAIPVETSADLVSVVGYVAVADRILFDARAPKDATRPGGLGTPFDWHLLENLKLAVPFMVAGGINAANVAEALRITRAAGADVSSWVESAPGVKDIAMIRAFVAAARSAEVAPAPSALARSLKRQGP